VLNLTRAVCIVLLGALAIGCTSVTTPASDSPSTAAALPSSLVASSAGPTTLPGASLGATSFPSAAPTLPPLSTIGPSPSATTGRTPKPTKAATPTPSPTPPPAKVKSFTAPQTVDCNVDPEPTQIHLEWSVARATGVTISIDGPGIYDSYDGATGAADLPFACGSEKHKYLLTTTGSDGAVATETRVVKRALPKIRNVYADNLTIQGQCSQVYQRRVYWNVENATGVTVTVGGQTYGPYAGHDNNDLFPYDCRNSETVTYHVETTGYGPAATFDYVLPYASTT
jgi:hypothetical protein